jgi:hypothetical protein
MTQIDDPPTDSLATGGESSTQKLYDKCMALARNL